MLNQDEFLNEYKNEHIFQKSGLSWECMESIYDDYQNNSGIYEKNCNQITEYILEGMACPIESIKCRYKDGKHLIEKIIRKRGIEQNHKYKDINCYNYKEIIRDLIGVRILILAKEDWEAVFDWLMKRFPTFEDGKDVYMAERPEAYTRYGDRDIFHDKIHQEHTNKGYRSQHYIVYFKGVYCEIQVRTLAEELHGEFDHKVRYPYRNKNKFLKRYTGTMAQLTDSIDELISTCFQMGKEGWDQNDDYYTEDTFIDWEHTSRNPIQNKIEETNASAKQKEDILTIVNKKLQRKEK